MTYENVRHPDLLGRIIGKRLVDVTQHDKYDYDERGRFVALHFDDGTTVTFPDVQQFSVEGGGE